MGLPVGPVSPISTDSVVYPFPPGLTALDLHKGRPVTD